MTDESNPLPPPPSWPASNTDTPDAGLTTQPTASPGFDAEVARKAVWELGRVTPSEEAVRREFLLLLDRWGDDESHNQLIYRGQQAGVLDYVARMYKAIQALDPVDLRTQEALRRVAATSMFSAGVGTGAPREGTKRIPGLLWLSAGLSLGGTLFVTSTAVRVGLGLVFGATLIAVLWSYARHR